MNLLPEPGLYVGKVWHKRHRPREHAFRYPVFYLMADVLWLDRPERAPRLSGLGFNRFNLFSLTRRDYGTGVASTLAADIASLMLDAGYIGPLDHILMLTMPRVLGYGFNPITVYYCCTCDSLAGVVYEVRNTFGERHHYVFRTDAGTLPGHEADKMMHVSPFYPVAGCYRFHQRPPGEKLALSIDYRGADRERDLTACLTGVRRPLTGGMLARLFVRLPFLSVKVMAAIHFEALRLWLKRLRVYRKPPRADVTTSTCHTFPKAKGT
ncbi:MAG: DUF1365 domain-containing protein [Alphaproteobacteria bacterium]|nr:MAG: DUF1365 domain-containing protein [Alphaproteobacteria bacterium]